jgi:hypothetical protein
MHLFPRALCLLALAGCATQASLSDDLAPAPAAAAPRASTPRVPTARQLVIPVTGGSMLVALPLGGSAFLPVDETVVTGLAASR